MINRTEVLEKYGSKCAYCGNDITIKTMQVDHIWPKRMGYKPDNSFENLNPSCRSCNHYKRAEHLENYRRLIKTIQDRLMKIYIFRVAVNYGIIKIEPFDGKFYFETGRREK